MKQVGLQFVLGAVMAAGVFAQVHGGPIPNRVPTKQPKRADKQAAAGRQAPGQHPLDYYASLPPEQRKAQLAKLPPQRAEKIESGVERWNKMTPEQKEVARSMTPETRKIAADHRAWLVQQPTERQAAIRHQTQLLRQMSPEARQAEMNSPTFRHRFDATEREHIKKIISIVPESAAGSTIE